MNLFFVTAISALCCVFIFTVSRQQMYLIDTASLIERTTQERCLSETGLSYACEYAQKNWSKLAPVTRMTVTLIPDKKPIFMSLELTKDKDRLTIEVLCGQHKKALVCALVGGTGAQVSLTICSWTV
jgi:hypothetical protein